MTQQTPMQDDLQSWLNEHEEKGQRTPFVTRGNYTLKLNEMREKATERQVMGVDATGKQVPVTVKSTDAYFLEGVVESSDNPSHPIGSKVCVYYSMKPSKYRQNGDEDQLRDLFFAILQSTGVVPQGQSMKQIAATDLARAQLIYSLYPRLKSEPKFVEGIRLGLNVQPKKDRRDDPDAYCYKNWRPILGQGQASAG